jgi:putative phosphoribosyl transferase
MTQAKINQIQIPVNEIFLTGDLAIPAKPKGMIIFSHGSGSNRMSPRNRFVAGVMQNAGFVTLLFDLLTKEEDLDVKNRFDIDLLTERLISVTQWIKNHTEFGQWHTGYFGASTGAASAVRAAARLGVDIVEAVVSRGGRPDLASDLLDSVECPVLLIVGAKDDAVFELNRQAMEKLKSIKALITIPGATHLFEEEGAMDQVADQAGSWFEKYLYKKHLEIDKDFIV